MSDIAAGMVSVNIPVSPLTADAFKSYGQVIQAYTKKPWDLKVTPANEGTALKFHKLSLLESSYPSSAGATTGISVYRCQPLKDIQHGITTLKALERHSYTNQAFIPMGTGSNNDPSLRSKGYLVVVALNGPDDRPDMKTLRAFLANTAQGISYNCGIWHQPMTVLGEGLDFACIETQIGDGSTMDCEIIYLDPSPRYSLELSEEDTLEVGVH